jgi:transglutaminase-like putative cysteine protease
MARHDAGAAVSVERFSQFSLLGLVASGYLAVAGSGYLDTPTIALTAAGFLVRAAMICGFIRIEPSDRAVTGATLSYILFFGLDYFVLSRSFLTATVHLVFFLAVMKVLTSRTNRDYLYTAAIAFMELLAAAILSISLSFFLLLALFLLFAMAALTSAEIRRSMSKARTTARYGQRRFHPRLAVLATLVSAGILVLTAGLFFLLPRTADAAFSRLISHRIYLPGFSDHVKLGEIGEFKTSSRPVMHVAIYSSEPAVGLKWRGEALVNFDGRSWSNPYPERTRVPDSQQRGHINLVPSQFHRNGRRISYTVEVDGLENDSLFFAGFPEQVELRDSRLYRSETDSYHMGHPPQPGFRYEAYSLIEALPEEGVAVSPAPLISPVERHANLQLPLLDQRIPQLAHTMTAGASNDLERARAIEHHLRADYGYTLEFPRIEPAHPLENFLFVRKKGHCEYFASAMVVLLREIGVPARMATGFQSGVYNPITDLWLIRAADAHSWVEAWLPDRGWTTFDPTPPDPNPSNLSLSTRLNLYLDAANTFWQEWVVSYDPGHQGTLADKFQQGAGRLGIRWFDSLSGAESIWSQHTVLWFRRYGLTVLGIVALGGFLWVFGPPLIRMVRIRRRVDQVRRGHGSVADATLLYQRMLQILKRRGFQKPVWFTPAEFASSLPSTPMAGRVQEFTATYNALRFGGRTEVAAQLSSLLDQLERESETLA